MLDISVRADWAKLEKDLDGLARRQIPFATATALTNTARVVAHAEAAAMRSTFDRPTPFTLNAVGVIAARKDRWIATVFVKDIQAVYLLPYEDGGKQVLGNKRAILTPRDLATNQYGNIPRGKIASLAGRSDIFIGSVKTRAGKTISGVWQRSTPPPAKGARRPRGLRANTSGHLRLLVQFTNPATVTHPLHYRERAERLIRAAFPEEFRRAMNQALATAH